MKKILLSYLLVSLVTRLFSQTPNIEWQKCFGGSQVEAPEKIIQTYEGGYIMTGFTTSFDGDVSNNNGGSDIWVIKLDNQGNIEWQKTVGGLSHESSSDIIQTSDGGYVIVGNSQSSDSGFVDNEGGQDFFIVKLNSNGNQEWAQSFGGSETDIANSVVELNDGTYVLTGSTMSNDGDITDTTFSSISTKIWVLKLSHNGSLIWDKTISLSANDNAYSIINDGSDLLITGQSHSISNGTIPVNKPNLLAIKIDSDGNVLWIKTYGGSQSDIAFSSTKTIDGGYVLAGYSYSSDGIVSENYGLNDFWVVKLDNQGNLIWERNYGGDDLESANQIIQTPDLGFIITGYTKSTTYDVMSNNISFTSNAWILKIDSIGTIEWESAIGGIESESGESIALSSDGGYIVTSTVNSDDQDVTCYNGENIWVVKLEGNQITSNEKNANKTFSFYPNPTRDILNFIEKINSYTITDVNNKVIESNQSYNKNIIDMTYLYPGVYFVEVTTSNTTYRQQIIKK